MCGCKNCIYFFPFFVFTADEETDCKSEPLTPPSNTATTLPPGLKRETPQLVVFNNQVRMSFFMSFSGNELVQLQLS